MGDELMKDNIFTNKYLYDKFKKIQELKKLIDTQYEEAIIELQLNKERDVKPELLL